MEANQRPKLVGWSADELYIKVEVDGRERWVPVDGPADDGHDYCWVDGRRYFIGAGALYPRPAV